jgi:hypothetical protein
MGKHPDILLIGTEVKPYGIIKAVGWTGGERYYWFEDKHGSVAMMPAYIIEKRPLSQPLSAKADSLSLPNSPDGRERDVRHVD